MATKKSDSSDATDKTETFEGGRHGNIKFQPTDENWPKHKKAHTNIGEFFPGEVRGVSPGQEAEADRLIANGEFVASDEEPNSSDLAEGVIQSQVEEAKKPAEKAEPARTTEAPADRSPAAKKDGTEAASDRGRKK